MVDGPEAEVAHDSRIRSGAYVLCLAGLCIPGLRSPRTQAQPRLGGTKPRPCNARRAIPLSYVGSVRMESCSGQLVDRIACPAVAHTMRSRGESPVGRFGLEEALRPGALELASAACRAY